jgi:hypothetical protein
MRINEIITESTELEEGWKSKVGAAALAGLGLLGAGGASAADVQDPSWSTAGYDSHIKADSSLTKKTSSDGVSAPKTSKDLQSRISDVTGPNAEGQYRVTVTQNGKIASQYVTKTPPPGWLVKESTELEEGWKSKLGAAALAGAAMLGGGHQDAQAQNYQPTAQTQQVLRLSSQDVKLAQQIGELSVLMNDAKFRSMISPEQKRIYDNGYSTLQSRWGKFGQADNQYLENTWKSGQRNASLREFYGRANMPRSNGDLDRWLDQKFGTRSSPQLSSGGVRAGANGYK